MVPDDVVARCGLAAGLELDRPVLRRLRNELRRTEALAVAGKALRGRDLSRRRLAERLTRAGVAPGSRQAAIAALAAAGAVDDARLAGRRAASLAERGWGDSAVRARLEGDGIGPGESAAAIEALAPELERAAALVTGVRDRRQAWTLLARRGFEHDTIEAVVAPLDEEAGAGLG
jgi:SOS response regulatory protein OraA/RecX